MLIEFEAGLTDDNDFVEVARAIMNGVAAQYAPEHVWVVQVDNWVDQKWLRFSRDGRVSNPRFCVVMAGDKLADRFDIVKAEFTQTQVTIPPFSPNRILGQWSLARSGIDYCEFPLKEALHRWEKARSSENLHRRAIGEQTCLFWFSGNT